MGEHTVREILKRRGKDTQRALQRRRELAQGGDVKESHWPKVVLALVVLVIVGCLVEVLYLMHIANERFVTVRATRATETYLALSSTTEFLPNTLLAAVDPDFYNENSTSGTLLTRRLVRTYFPVNGPLRNRIMATVLDLRHSRTEVLEEFINNASFGESSGHAVRGFGAASLEYFGKPFSQLTPQDIALLVAVMQDPEGLDPRLHPDKALSARNAVLELDQQQSILSEAQTAALKQTPLDVTGPAAP